MRVISKKTFEIVRGGILAAAVLAMVGCDGSSNDRHADAGADHPSSGDGGEDDVATDRGDGGDASCGAIPNINCLRVFARQGNLLYCGDVGMLPICMDGQYVCPTEMVEASQCTCTGPTQVCQACAFAGWQCPDGGDAGADR